MLKFEINYHIPCMENFHSNTAEVKRKLFRLCINGILKILPATWYKWKADVQRLTKIILIPDIFNESFKLPGCQLNRKMNITILRKFLQHSKYLYFYPPLTHRAHVWWYKLTKLTNHGPFRYLKQNLVVIIILKILFWNLEFLPSQEKGATIFFPKHFFLFRPWLALLSYLGNSRMIKDNYFQGMNPKKLNHNSWMKIVISLLYSSWFWQ